MNSFNLALSGKHFICPSILNESFAGYSNLGCRSLPFMTWNTSCQPLVACKVSFEKSADNLMRTPLQVTVSLSLADFKILSLSLILGNVIMMCASLGPSSLGLYELPGLPGSLFLLPDWRSSPSLFFQINFQFLALSLFFLICFSDDLFLVCGGGILESTSQSFHVSCLLLTKVLSFEFICPLVLAWKAEADPGSPKSGGASLWTAPQGQKLAHPRRPLLGCTARQCLSEWAVQYLHADKLGGTTEE